MTVTIQLKLETDPRAEDLYPQPPCARGSVSPSPYKVALSHIPAWGTGPQPTGKPPSTEGLVLTDPQTCLISIERVHYQTSEATGARTSTVHADKAVIEHSVALALTVQGRLHPREERVNEDSARTVSSREWPLEFSHHGTAQGCIPIPESTS